MSNDKFMFFENFKATADKLPDDMRLKFYDALTDYVFNGTESDDPVISAIITAFKPSLDKVETRGGNHNPTGQNQYSKVKSGQKEVKNAQSGQSFLETETERETEVKKENNIKERKKLEDVCDWESLFTYWEQNKKGGKYKNTESRNRQLAKLKQLTNENYDFAKEAILFCLDNNYQGFTDGQKLYYRGTDVRECPEETVTIDEGLKFDETMPEFKDMTFDDCCRAYDWLQDKMYLQVITKPKFVELVRKFKGVA